MLHLQDGRDFLWINYLFGICKNYYRWKFQRNSKDFWRRFITVGETWRQKDNQHWIGGRKSANNIFFCRKMVETVFSSWFTVFEIDVLKRDNLVIKTPRLSWKKSPNEMVTFSLNRDYALIIIFSRKELTGILQNNWIEFNGLQLYMKEYHQSCNRNTGK